ncbi:GNAT family N-acetyltransferase [Streptomyces sp. NPDC001717]|uniref:GNAT family N-acetyltransferase n=1 Tax=Streptomyces sp. NPDC001717 TaxID=3364604 RepID=UPI0036899D10
MRERAWGRGRVVAAACAWRRRTGQIGVLTAPEARGRGLARAVGSAVVAHALAVGVCRCAELVPDPPFLRFPGLRPGPRASNAGGAECGASPQSPRLKCRRG